MFNPILPGGGGGAKTCPPLLFFLHHRKTDLGIKLKLSDFKDTPLRHILQVKPVCYIGNKITEGTLQGLAPQKSKKSAICTDIEQKFGIETEIGPLSSNTNKNLQFDVDMTS